MTDKTDALVALADEIAADIESAKQMPIQIPRALAKDWEQKLRALAAPATAVVTDGWQLVPRIITPEMEDAADMRDDDEPLSDWGKVRDASRQAIWDAMLAAAPAAPKGGMDESKELLDAKVIDSLIVANEEWQAVAAKLAACLSDAIAGECPIPLFHASSAALQGYAALATGEQP